MGANELVDSKKAIILGGCLWYIKMRLQVEMELDN